MTSCLSPDNHSAAAADDEDETTLFPDHIHLNNDNPPESPSPTYHRHHLPSTEATVTVRLLPSQGLSFQLWPSSLSLLSSLSSPFSTLLPPSLSSSPRCRLRILELGSGAGLVGISFAAALGAEVTVTDLPHVLPNLLHNVDLNSSVLRESGGEVRVLQLRWGEIEDVVNVGRGFDLVVAADVVYYDYLYEPLLKTLRWLFEGKRRDEMVFVMGHVRRWKKDNLFFRKARKWFDVEVLWTDREVYEGSRSGVIVYRFSSKAQNPSTAILPEGNEVPDQCI